MGIVAAPQISNPTWRAAISASVAAADIAVNLTAAARPAGSRRRIVRYDNHRSTSTDPSFTAGKDL